jgi:hypothetical protein
MGSLVKIVVCNNLHTPSIIFIQKLHIGIYSVHNILSSWTASIINLEIKSRVQTFIYGKNLPEHHLTYTLLLFGICLFYIF